MGSATTSASKPVGDDPRWLPVLGRGTERRRGLMVLHPTDAGSLISLSGHTTIDTFGNRSQICDQLYPRETPTPVARRAPP